MIKKYVEKFINNLTKEDLNNYLKRENIILDIDEFNFCFNYIKKNWNLLFINHGQILSDLKLNLKPTTYKQIEPILINYQNKYKNYL